MYVVKDDFPIDYEGIFGIDFLTKQHVDSHGGFLGAPREEDENRH